VITAAFVIALVPSVASAQKVTQVPNGNTLMVDGVGRVRLLGITSADQPALQMGPSGPPQPPRRDPPTTPAPPLVGGSVSLTPERPSRDFLRKIALGRTVRIEYDPLVSRDRGAYLFLDDGTLINAEMLKAGKARLDDSRQFVREKEFKALQEQARSNSLGIWIK